MKSAIKTHRLGAGLALLLVAVSTIMVTGPAQALQSDRKKPIHITSDTADIDDRKGISIYRGDVVMTQGTTLLKGDTVTIHSIDREITRMIAVGDGRQAYYEEEQEDDKGILKAWGLTINYDIEKNTVELIKQAKLIQSGDTFTGERIDYDKTAQLVNANSNTGKTGERVEMVIQPRNSDK